MIDHKRGQSNAYATEEADDDDDGKRNGKSDVSARYLQGLHVKPYDILMSGLRIFQGTRLQHAINR
jgi:hypothetical protein